MGKFKEGQLVCITAGPHEGEHGIVILPHGWSYAVRLEGSGEVIYEHNLSHIRGSREAEEAERRAEEVERAKEARAAERRLEEEAEFAARTAIRRAEEAERAAREAQEADARREAEAERLALGAHSPRTPAASPRRDDPSSASRRAAARSPAVGEEDEAGLFERTDAAPQTYPVQAGDVRRGSHLMIKGHPCRCTDVSSSKTGKHGHAKSHIVAVDVFTGKKYEDLYPSSHYIEVPYVKRMEYQLLNVDPETGEVSLLHMSGNTKEDLNLPTFAKASEQTDDDRRLQRDIVEAFELGKTVIVAVVSACGEEKIVEMKVL